MQKAHIQRLFSKAFLNCTSSKNNFFFFFTKKKCFSSVPFVYQNVYEQPIASSIEYRKLDRLSEYIHINEMFGKRFLNIKPEALSILTEEAIIDVSFLLRPSHLRQLADILKDPEASSNDRFVATELLKNANISSAKILPGCQDTGTAIIIGKKGQYVLTDGKDEEHFSRGIYNAYVNHNLRYSQLSPISMFNEKNTKCNLPGQIEISSVDGESYNLLFITKGGGSANKTFLFSQSKAILNKNSLENFLEDNIRSIGTSACPPYHLGIVIGGLSAEHTLKTLKLATCRYLDNLNVTGNDHGRAFRDIEWEDTILKMSQKIGIGAQFGGKYFCHDVRVIRLPRHGASVFVGIGVSCSADRQAVAKITADGVFLEKLEDNPAEYLDVTDDHTLQNDVIHININRPMKEILKELSKCQTGTRVSLSGILIVARDIAHAKLAEKLKTSNELPDYVKNHPIYYAGPAKTPDGYVSGSFGPTTAGRMDPYVSDFMAHGASLITLAKGNRSKQVSEACKKYGGFYLGSIGGPAAILAKNCIKRVEIVDYEELGMEAIWKIEVENFPAFVVVDHNGNDFYKKFVG